MSAHILTPADLTAALDNPWAIFLTVVVASIIVALATEAAIRRLNLRRHLEPVEPIEDIDDDAWIRGLWRHIEADEEVRRG